MAIAALSWITACSGGGCSGCGYLQPIPEGFQSDNVIANAVSARVTRPGLDFVGDNALNVATKLLGSGTFAPVDGKIAFTLPTFEVPGLLTLCPDGPTQGDDPTCTAQIDVENTRSASTAWRRAPSASRAPSRSSSRTSR